MHDPTSEAPLSIRLFGSFHVRLAGRPLPSLRSRKGEWLLALLVLRAGRPVAREWLAENLWPDSLPDDARTSLRQSLKDLRTALGEQEWRIEAVAGRRLALDLTGAEVDVWEFEAGVRAGDAERLRRAIELYAGPLLEGCAETWVVAEREEREQAYLIALERLAHAAEAQGDPAAAVGYRRRAAAAAPLTEPIQRALITALAHGGETQAAVDVYQQLRRNLYREHGTEPDTETTALFQQIRAEARSKGETATSKRKPHPAKTGLPTPLTALIGRQAELAEIENRLLTARLVTLTGTGGVGKTRLALAAAAEAAPQFANGAYFVDLSGIHSEAMILSAISAALGLERDLGTPQHLTTALSTRQLLLVLDNCEHLLGACARLANALVTQCPQLRILATSREPLGITGEVRVPLTPLALPTAASPDYPVTIEQARASPAVRLFCERAAAVCAGFKLTSAEAPIAAELCRRLDGLPLALELSAALTDVLPLSEILQRLDDRFRLLSIGDPSRPERQQTLTAMVDWSYEQLDADERRLFRRAAVFAGNWSLAALDVVGADLPSPAFPVLARLIRKSLVVPEETRAGGRRYRMLETLREYAAQRLAEAGEAETIRRRHLEWVAALVSEAEPDLTGPEQVSTLARLSADEENLSGALEWALDPQRKVEDYVLGSRLAAQLGRYWQIRGLYAEGHRHLRRSLERDLEEPRLRASLLGWAGFLALYRGHYATAVQLAKESLQAWEALGDDRGRAEALGTLAIAAKDQGDRVTAHTHFEESRQLWERVGDRRGLAGALGYLGILAVDAGNADAAEELFGRALGLRRSLQDVWGIAASLNNLGRLAAGRGDLERAHALLAESLEFRRKLGDRRCMAVTLNSLGTLLLKQADLQPAARHFAESLELVTKIGDRRSIAYSLEAVARLAIAAEYPAEGLRLLAAAANLRTLLSAPLSAPEATVQDRLIESLRERLGERESSRHQVAGEALSQAQAATLARSVLQRLAGQTTAAI